MQDFTSCVCFNGLPIGRMFCVSSHDYVNLDFCLQFRRPRYHFTSPGNLIIRAYQQLQINLGFQLPPASAVVPPRYLTFPRGSGRFNSSCCFGTSVCSNIIGTQSIGPLPVIRSEHSWASVSTLPFVLKSISLVPTYLSRHETCVGRYRSLLRVPSWVFPCCLFLLLNYVSFVSLSTSCPESIALPPVEISM